MVNCFSNDFLHLHINLIHLDNYNSLQTITIMKIAIKENAIEPNELKEALAKHFEGKFNVSSRNAKMVVVAQDKTIGTTILVRKNSLIVNGNFATVGSQMVFTLVFILLGILIPIVIYFAVYHKKMKAVEKEVSDFITDNYSEQFA